MAYRNVPWQRNLNRIPAHVAVSLAEIHTERVLVAATKTVKRSEIPTVYGHLAFPTTQGEVTQTSPQIDMGKWSKRNQNGWEVVRTDLPKTSKTSYWETPNYGDASRFGTHLHYIVREVYQREFHEPQHYLILIEMLESGRGDEALYKFSLDQSLDRTHRQFIKSGLKVYH
jgi:hypothetical protein